MWNNFLLVRVKPKGWRHSLPIPPVALFPIRDAMVSLDGYLGLLPGRLGDSVRFKADLIRSLICGATTADIHVEVDTGRGPDAVNVRVHTV